MDIRFFPHKFNNQSAKVLDLVNKILEKYRDLLPITLRQIFYLTMSVEKSPIQNTKRDYKRLSRLLRDARYCGIIPFDYIEDRTRYTSNLPVPLEEILWYYYPEAWDNQPYYIEVLVEKEGLRTFFRNILRPFYVPVTPMRGFDSLTDVMDVAKRIHKYEDRNRYVLIFSDFDPSGESIFKDFDFRLKKCLIMLGEEPVYYNESEKRAEVSNLYTMKIALTLEQVEKYNLPPMFVKAKDPRAKTFIEKYGSKAVVELDALPPEILKDILTEKITQYVYLDEVERIHQLERRVRTEGLKALKGLLDLESGDEEDEHGTH